MKITTPVEQPVKNLVTLPQASCGCGDVAQRQLPCCADRAATELKAHDPFVTGMMETKAGPVPKVDAAWTRGEYFEHLKARLGSFRMEYSVEPGLYAIGNPGEQSDVFVSANYKLSFDHLRRALEGMDAWILVIDTKGINVWCAAGKGTFGTEEIVRRIQATGVEKAVSHRRLIVPQLGAPGVSAAEVKRRTGFRVHFGPVTARDIPAYVAAGYTATPEMRRVAFGMANRLVLTPIELLPVMKRFPAYALFVLAVFGLQPDGIIFREAISGGWPFLLAGIIAALAGALLTPALLPFIPFRSFALKGWLLGLALIAGAAYAVPALMFDSPILLCVLFLFFPLLSSYLALQFTGATTFTNLSGVRKELKYALPVYIAGAVVSALAVIAYKLTEWGIV